MITAFQIAIERAGWYIGSGWHYLLFAAALLFLILKRDDKENRKWLVGYTLLFAAVYICPLTARIIMKYCIGGFVYWRMFWILPTSVIVAYVAVSVCTAGKKKTVQAVCASLLMALIIVTGKNPYVGGQAIYQKAVNMQKLPADACQISSLIAAARTEGETALAVMPEDLVGYVRQYDASIRLLYGRRSKSEKPVRKIRRQMRKEQPKIKKLIRRIRQQGVNYLVFLADEQQDAKPVALNSIKIDVTGLVKDSKYSVDISSDGYLFWKKECTAVEASNSAAYTKVAMVKDTYTEFDFTTVFKGWKLDTKPKLAVKGADNNSVKYASSDQETAAVNETTGVVNIKKAGKVSFTATLSVGDSYKTITQSDVAIAKLDQTLSFTDAKTEVYVGDEKD